MRIIIIILFIASPVIASAQQNIKVENIRNDIYYLASDSLKGRKTGTEGQKMAAEYIAAIFKEAGLVPAGNNEGTNPYFQRFSIYTPLQTYVFISNDTAIPSHRLKTSAYINKKYQPVVFDADAYRNNQHFLYISSAKIFSDSIRRVIYAYNPAEIEKSAGDATVVIEVKDLQQAESEIIRLYNSHNIKSFIIKLSGNKFEKILVNFPESRFLIGSEGGEKAFYKLGMLRPHKIKLPGEISLLYSFCQSHSDCEVFIAGPQLKKTLFPNKECRQSYMRYSAYNSGLWDSVETENVAALLEGKDKDIIVVGAHYDHLGGSDRGIYYGADDNASGTAAVIEIAREMADNARNGKIPGKSIVFIAFTAEEEGLIGSEAFLLNYPFSDRKIGYMINMDMIGRNDKRNDTLSNYTYCLPLAGKKHKMLKTAISASLDVMQSNIIRKPDIVNGILYRFGSDHHGFVRRNIPSMVFFTGLHNDYHKITDTPDKIWYSNNTVIAKIVCKTIYLIAGDAGIEK